MILVGFVILNLVSKADLNSLPFKYFTKLNINGFLYDLILKVIPKLSTGFPFLSKGKSLLRYLLKYSLTSVVHPGNLIIFHRKF